MTPVSEQVVFLGLLACPLVPWCFLCCDSSYPQGGAEYSSQVFVCNTTTSGYYRPKQCVVFVYLRCPIQFLGVLPTLGIASSTVCLRWIHFSSTSLGC